VAGSLTALGLCAVLVLAGPGSVQLFSDAKASAVPAGRVPKWIRPCLRAAPLGALRVGQCARVDGRVVASQTKAGGETHLVVVGGFHAMVVEVEPGAHLPGWGSRVVAVGPLIGTTLGLREMRALTLSGS
jgi:hypothetical protein